MKILHRCDKRWVLAALMVSASTLAAASDSASLLPRQISPGVYRMADGDRAPRHTVLDSRGADGKYGIDSLAALGPCTRGQAAPECLTYFISGEKTPVATAAGSSDSLQRVTTGQGSELVLAPAPPWHMDLNLGDGSFVSTNVADPEIAASASLPWGGKLGGLCFNCDDAGHNTHIQTFYRRNPDDGIEWQMAYFVRTASATQRKPGSWLTYQFSMRPHNGDWALLLHVSTPTTGKPAAVKPQPPEKLLASFNVFSGALAGSDKRILALPMSELMATGGAILDRMLADGLITEDINPASECGDEQDQGRHQQYCAYLTESQNIEFTRRFNRALDRLAASKRPAN